MSSAFQRRRILRFKNILEILIISGQTTKEFVWPLVFYSPKWCGLFGQNPNFRRKSWICLYIIPAGESVEEISKNKEMILNDRCNGIVVCWDH